DRLEGVEDLVQARAPRDQIGRITVESMDAATVRDDERVQSLDARATSRAPARGKTRHDVTKSGTVVRADGNSDAVHVDREAGSTGRPGGAGAVNRRSDGSGRARSWRGREATDFQGQTGDGDAPTPPSELEARASTRHHRGWRPMSLHAPS